MATTDDQRTVRSNVPNGGKRGRSRSEVICRMCIPRIYGHEGWALIPRLYPGSIEIFRSRRRRRRRRSRRQPEVGLKLRYLKNDLRYHYQ